SSDAAAEAHSIAALCRLEGLNVLGFILTPSAGAIIRLRSVARALESNGDLLFLEAPLPGADAGLLAGAALTDGLGDALCLVPSNTPAWPRSERRWTESPV